MSTEGLSQGPMQGVSELLRCYICMERLSNATICPHCSKLGCFPCIRRWVTDNRSNCPHCRNPLTLRDLIKIPLFDELGQVLDSLHACGKEASVTIPQDQEKCSTHQERMSVYCETCKESICHNCALFSKEHHGHSFKPLDDIYKKHVEVLQGELNKLNDRMKTILEQVQQVEKKMEGVKINKSKIKKELMHAMEKMVNQLDETAKERVHTLSEFRHYLRTQAMEITKESHKLEKTITAGNISSLVDSNGELKSELSDVIKKLLSSSYKIEDLPTLSNFVNEVVPEYNSAVFKISSFRELQRKGEEIYSEPLEIQGLVWRLKVYPNGHREEIGNYLAVFVELSEGYSKVSNYQYCIELLYGCTNKHPNRNHKREYSSDFADGESWGYCKYYELSRLHSDGFLKDNTLTLRFSVRAPTYYQKCMDQSMYLEKIVKERDTLKHHLHTAKGQITTLKAECKTLLEERRSANRSQQESHASSHASLPLHSSSQHMLHRSHTHSSHHHPREPHPSHHPREPHPSHLPPSHHPREPHPSHHPRDPHHHEELHSLPIAHHQSPSHFSGAGSKQHQGVAHFSPHHHHGDMRMLSSKSRVQTMAHSNGRRRSSDDSPDLRKVAEHFSAEEKRRKSAEHTAHLEQEGGPFQPSPYSHHRSGKKNWPHSQPHANPRGFEISSSSEDLEATSFSQHWEESPLNPADITITLEDGESEKMKSSSSNSTLIDSSSPPREQPQDSGGVTGGVAGGGERLLVLHQQHHLSQERFGDDDHREMLSLSGLATGPTPVPLSNFPLFYETSSYFGEHQEHMGHPSVAKNEQTTQQSGLSQPTYPSPPKSKHGKSMTDLTGSNMSLSCSQQYLSQSLADFQHFQHDMQRYASESSRQVSEQKSRRCHEHHFRGAQSQQQLQRMASDSHLNKSHAPGLQRSMISALVEVREEVEQKKQERGKKTSPNTTAISIHSKSQQQAAYKASQLQKKHVKATVVKNSKETGGQRTTHNKRRVDTNRNKSSPDKVRSSLPKSPASDSKGASTIITDTSTNMTSTAGEVQQDKQHKDDSEDMKKSLRTQPLSGGLSSTFKLKSNSTSSLNNLSQIL